MKPIQDENKAVAPVQAREHIESLHQNNYTTLLYGKNNVYVQPVSICHMADLFPLASLCIMLQSVHTLNII